MLRMLLCCALILSIVSSCTKFLDQRSDDSLRELADLSDYQALLDNFNGMNETNSANIAENSADHFFVTESVFNAFSEQERGFYRWNPVHYQWPNDWSVYYQIVGRANTALEGLNHIERTDKNAEVWDRIKGSALFYRSFAFLNLAWTYAKVYDEKTYEADMGIPLRTSTNFNLIVDRASVKDTYEKIVNDLTSAIGLLPNHSLHVFRPSNQALYALLARTYLSMGKYEQALHYTEQALTIGEVLLDFKSDLTAIQTNSPFPKHNKEIFFYFETGLLGGLRSATAHVDTMLYNSYVAEDLRKVAFFLPSGTYHRFKTNYSAKSARTFTGLATNELYLIQSECLARLNRDEEAAHVLTQLLSHRYIAGVDIQIPSGGDELLDRILLERRKELLNRGVRWSDIKRLNKEKRNIVLQRKVGNTVYELSPNDNRYALPLPVDIIENSNMKQNPK
ncbi:SusD-like starch-binding protein associating with outer membrane [Sphingobacterium yanglingense]|uniref:SusD-like starch-binding protein associating with outer membrane n=2 Tax=Sphingobacterium yanglingense TaxID=1437280 RepID=A0A4R6WGR1_9SPHI|nr:SusD-like starch-binding protein associating with outer membrane [Sphingobacterium yanglingense]